MKKIKYMIFFVFLLCFISVSYAAFSSQLNISGEGIVDTDTVPPICGSWFLRDSSLTIQEAYNQNKFVNPGTNTTWTNQNQSLFIECSDNMPGNYGCINVTEITDSNNNKRYFKEVKEYTTSIQTDSQAISVVLKDAYLNETTCTLPVGGSNPYLDNQAPVVTITPTSYNKFTYSATDDMGVQGYMVTTSSTAPALDDPNWLSEPEEVTVSNSVSRIYYVWVKDGVNVSNAYIQTVKLTKSQGDGTTLTIKYNNSTGIELNTAFVLRGTNIYVTGSLNEGYKNLVLKNDNNIINDGSIQTMNGGGTISSTATPNTYTVTADANGGGMTSTIGWTGSGASTTKSVTFDSAYGTLPTPARAGYTFVEWTGKNLFKKQGTHSGGGVGVEVAYDSATQTYTLNGTVEREGNLILSNGSLYINPGEQITMSVTNISGTANLASGTGITYAYSIFTQDLNYYIRGSVSTDSFQPTYKFTKNMISSSGGPNYKVLLQLWRVGTTFNNYKIKIQIEKGSTATTFEPFGITENSIVKNPNNHTITAQWTPNQYTVTANANGGSISSTSGWTGTGNTATKRVTYNSEYGTLPIPTKTNYTFDGWSFLPQGYKQVEYIQGTGTQYIILNHKPGPETGVSVKFQYTDLILQQPIFGVRGDNSDEESFTYTFYINSNSNWAYGFKNGSGNWVNTQEPADTDVHTLAFNVNNGIYNFDSDETIRIAGSTRTNTSPYNMFIMTQTRDGLVPAAGIPKSKIKIYSFSVYENSILIYNFIPCIEESTGKAGLYDTITGTFYDNDGSGDDFVVGNEIHVTEESIMNIAHAHTLYATWKPNQYTVTANANGGSIPSTSGWTGSGASATKSVTYTSTYGTLPTPTKPGYTFAGWTDNLADVINEDNYRRTNYASRTPSELKNDGNIDNLFNQPYVRFNGYQEDSNADTSYSIKNNNPISVEPGETYTLKFYVRSQNAVGTQYMCSTHYDSYNCTRIEWGDGTRTYLSSSKGFKNDGEWHVISETFVVPSGVTSANLSIGNDSPNLYGVGSYLDIGGIMFYKNTSDSLNGYNIENTSIVAIPNNHTIKAKWIPTSYTVTFDADGGTVDPSSKTVNYDSAYGVLPIPIKPNYEFKGWSLSDDYYEDLEYLESTGTQYILTDIIPSGDGKVVADVSVPSYTGETAFMGSRTTMFGEAIEFYFSGGVPYLYTGSASSIGGGNSVYNQKVHYEGSYSPTTLSLSTDTNGDYSKSAYYNADNNQTPFMIFAYNRYGTAEYLFRGKIYNIDIYDNNELTHRLIPARRKSDDALGLRDMVTGTFYTNSGTGTFIGGPTKTITSDTIVYTPSDHTLVAEWEYLGRTVTFDANGGTVDPSTKTVYIGDTYGTLPTPTKTGHTFTGWTDFIPGYTKLEYIEGTGTQYIRTDILPVSNNKIEADIYQVSTYSSETAFMGVRDSSTGIGLEYYYSGGVPYFWGSPCGTIGGGSSAYDRVVHYEVTHSSTGTTLYTSTNGTYSNNFVYNGTGNVTPYTIFAYNNYGSAGYYFRGRVYGIKIYESGVLAHDLIPVKRNSDTEYGLYDLITGSFYTNSGTGTFTPGSEISTNTITSSSTVTKTEDHKLYANWNTNTFTINYDKNSSTATGTMSSQLITYGSSVTLTANAFADSGYVFAGWNTEADGSGTSYSDEDPAGTISSTNLDVVTLYAQWEEANYQVGNSYYSTLAKALEACSFTGSTITVLKNNTDTSVVSITSDKITSVTLDPNGKTINRSGNNIVVGNGTTLNINGSGTINFTTGSLQIASGGTVNQTTAIIIGTGTKVVDNSGTMTINQAVVGGTADYGIYNNSSGTVTIYTGGNVSGKTGIINSGTLNIGDANASLSTTSPIVYGSTGYAVEGNFNLYNGELGATSTPTYNGTLTPRTGYTDYTTTAQGGYQTYLRKTVTVTFDANGGTVSPLSKVVMVGDTYGELPTPEKTYYTFNGWKDTNSNTITAASTVSSNSDHTLTADYTPENYSITYNLNGGTVSPANPTSYNIESSAITLNNPTRTGYTFTGWTGSNGNTPQTSITIPAGSTGAKSYTANWSINSYTITVTPSTNVTSCSMTGCTSGQACNYGTQYTITCTKKANSTWSTWSYTNGDNYGSYRYKNVDTYGTPTGFTCSGTTCTLTSTVGTSNKTYTVSAPASTGKTQCSHRESNIKTFSYSNFKGCFSTGSGSGCDLTTSPWRTNGSYCAWTGYTGNGPDIPVYDNGGTGNLNAVIFKVNVTSGYASVFVQTNDPQLLRYQYQFDYSYTLYEGSSGSGLSTSAAGRLNGSGASYSIANSFYSSLRWVSSSCP